MMITEVRKWAKEKGYEVKTSKENGGYNWRHPSEEEYIFSKNVDDLATDIFNHLTKNKWKSYQENYTKPEKFRPS